MKAKYTISVSGTLVSMSENILQAESIYLGKLYHWLEVERKSVWKMLQKGKTQAFQPYRAYYLKKNIYLKIKIAIILLTEYALFVRYCAK